MEILFLRNFREKKVCSEYDLYVKDYASMGRDKSKLNPFERKITDFQRDKWYEDFPHRCPNPTKQQARLDKLKILSELRKEAIVKEEITREKIFLFDHFFPEKAFSKMVDLINRQTDMNANAKSDIIKTQFRVYLSEVEAWYSSLSQESALRLLLKEQDYDQRGQPVETTRNCFFELTRDNIDTQSSARSLRFILFNGRHNTGIPLTYYINNQIVDGFEILEIELRPHFTSPISYSASIE